jgi:hypothetical protein
MQSTKWPAEQFCQGGQNYGSGAQKGSKKFKGVKKSTLKFFQIGHKKRLTFRKYFPRSWQHCGKSSSLEKSRTKPHPDGRHFLKVPQYENGIKINK